MICPQCQSENREGAKFCNECGLPLSGKIAEMAAAAAADDARAAETAVSTSETDLDPDFEGAVSADGEEGVASSDRRESSGPLDPSVLPAIDVAGVNVDEDGNAFDFGPIGDDGEESDEPEGVVFPPINGANQGETDDPGKTADLSGLDECLVDSGYVPPQKSWRSGDTMEMHPIDGKEAPKQKEFRAPDANAKKGGKGKIVVIALLCLAVIAGVAAGATYYFEIWGGKMLPDVVNMTQADATSVLEGKGFSVRATSVKSDETEGLVLLMDPGAGAREEEGSEVVIHISEARTVPDVVGRQRDEAQGQLAEDGFENVTIVTQKSDEREGVVLSVEPAAGEKAKAATPITMTVAVPYTVPDIAGKTWDEAVAALEAEGYETQSAYVYDDSVPDGTILGTDPAAGSKLASGSTVTINLSRARGAELVAAAQAYLGSIGSITLGGTSYEIQSVDGVTYQGNETTAFTITGSAVTTLDGETVRGSAKQKSGVIVWDANNNIVSVS